MSQLKEGNRQFKNGNYEKAQKLYEDALIDAPYSSILQFNAGDAAYQMGDFPKAEKSFGEAAQSANPILKGGAHYNRGNALFRQQKWADAVEAYKDSLRANPHDEDARYNLSVAMQVLKNPPKQPQSGQGQPKEAKNGKGQEGEQKQPAAGAQPKPGQMSEEDAERLLAAASAGERKRTNQKAPKNDVPHPDEDW